jgi:hypothetical protein
MVSNAMARIDHGLDINGLKGFTKWVCRCGESVSPLSFYSCTSPSRRNFQSPSFRSHSKSGTPCSPGLHLLGRSPCRGPMRRVPNSRSNIHLSPGEAIVSWRSTVHPSTVRQPVRYSFAGSRVGLGLGLVAIIVSRSIACWYALNDARPIS